MTTAARPSRRARLATVPVALALMLPVLAHPAHGALPSRPQQAEETLAAILEELQQDEEREGPGPELSLEAAEEDARRARRVLRRLDAIAEEDLSHDDWLTVRVLQWNAQATIDGVDLFWYEPVLLDATGPFRDILARAGSQRFPDREAVDAYLEYLDSLPETVARTLEKARGRAARGIVVPDEQIDRSVRMIEGLMRTDERNPLVPGGERAAQLPAADAEALRQGVRERLERDLVPALEQLRRYVDGTLRQRAPNAVGLAQYPGGRRAYRIAVRLYTTLDVTPEEVHEIGLAAVHDLESQMADVRAELGFAGTRDEFHQELRRDPRFYVDVPEAFGERLLEYDARIRPRMQDFFLRMPEAPYTVRRLDPAFEGSMTYGYYSIPTDEDPSGYYNYNGSSLEERSLLSGPALTYHELIPGHHYQIALAQENEDLPELRRNAYYSGYGEGWGEYASSVVAREMGMYEDPHDLYGRLVFDMFFAVRLVVDTGMNYFSWSRPKAMLTMRTLTMESDTQIDSETIRYSTRTPAQALAYGMGRDTWVRLRRQAEAALGDGFDVRRFHDAVLGTGSLPLVVLEEHLDWWIEQERQRLAG